MNVYQRNQNNCPDINKANIVDPASHPFRNQMIGRFMERPTRPLRQTESTRAKNTVIPNNSTISGIRMNGLRR